METTKDYTVNPQRLEHNCALIKGGSKVSELHLVNPLQAFNKTPRKAHPEERVLLYVQFV